MKEEYILFDFGQRRELDRMSMDRMRAASLNGILARLGANSRYISGGSLHRLSDPTWGADDGQA